jgi:chromosomal replication initiation ATPase DnaA
VSALRQLALPFPHDPLYHAEDFLAASSNEAALSWLARPAEWPARRLAIWGQEGVGKTHLLHLWAARERARIMPGSSLRGLPPVPPGAVAIDDADDCADERALLHLLNFAAELGQSVLLASRQPPVRWPVRLPDLASRLNAVTAVQLAPPEDSLLAALLARLLLDRQLVVPEALQSWLLLRLPRTPAALREAAARIDRATLASGRRVDRDVLARVIDSLVPDANRDVLASPAADASQPPGLMV